MMRPLPLYVFLFVAGSAAVISCGQKAEKKTAQASTALFQRLPVERTGISFKNTVKADFDLNIIEYNYFYNGGGVAAADFNNDGLTDLYFSGNQVQGKLYLNKGDFHFEDVTEKAGLKTGNWETGVAVADINNDGLPDIYISYAGYADPAKRTHQLYINKGNDAAGVPVFEEAAEKYGLADSSYTTQTCFFDFDRDGDLDMLMINHYQDKTNPNLPKPKDARINAPARARLFRNDNGHFTDISATAGISEDGYGLGVCVSDVNQDGWPDIYISKDFIFDDALYINNKNGTFTESLKKYIQHTARFSMGCDIADFNNDGYPDLLTVDMLPDSNRRQKMMNGAMNNDRFNYALSLGYTPQYSRNMLQLNNGPDAKGQFSFSEIGQLAGVDKTDWSWSPLFADFDNDGWKDIFISNGIPKDITNNDFISYRTKAIQDFSSYATLKTDLLTRIDRLDPVEKSNFFFQNQGDLRFSDQSASWGLDGKGFSSGAVYADLDNDGDLDLVTNNLNDYPSVYRNNRNNLPANHFLRVQLRGSFSTGATITIDCQGRKQFLEHNPVRGFQSSQDPIEHFGLGRDSIIDTLTVVWLDGKTQQLFRIKANQLLTLNYKDAVTRKPADVKAASLFADITETAGIQFTHVEGPFEDFDFEPLLPHRFSREGPYMAKADVDGNGLEDLWIGGPLNIPGKLFLQQTNGHFLSRNMPDSGYEDAGGIFFDANGDKHPDLYVVSGGNEFNPNTASYQDRLYINDGKGNFKRDTAALPKEFASGSCVAASDFNKDGAVDLFVGGMVTPGSYPMPPRSFILQNDGKGKFRDVTEQVCPELANIGLVTAAIWSDFDQDGWADLILTGEWMPITFFRNDHGKLKRWINNPLMDASTGWWNCIAEADFDHDGDTDYIIGNLGLNNKFHASPQTPLSVYAKDFDGNGRIESILTYYLNGREYTVADRDQIAFVIPFIKKKFDTYSQFAGSEFGDIFSPQQLEGALKLSATQLASVYLENKGHGKFDIRPLPTEAQFSSIQSIQTGDFDGDGNMDAIIAGNNFGADFMTGRYDASVGLLLKGDGRGGFAPLPAGKSGIFLNGDVRSTLLIKIKDNSSFLGAVNDGKLKCFKLNGH